MLKVGIIGCGKIAEDHAKEILKIPYCKIIAACDTEQLMAQQLCERYNIESAYSSTDEMLLTAKPNVIHITTPPFSHYDLGKKCLEAGCHVYMEKPFTLYFNEAEDLIEISKKRNLKITVGHNYQFDPAVLQMRKLINNGFLRGDPVHIESTYCYSWGNDEFAKALLGNKNHWVRKLPGKLLHNIISHGVARIAEFMDSDSPTVIVLGYSSPYLKEINEGDITDELRTIIYGENVSAYFTFSSQFKPGINELRLFGKENALIVDYNHQTVIKKENKQYKSYLNRLLPPFILSKQYFSCACRNMNKFLKAEFHFNSGMNTLINLFYKSIQNNSNPPIPYEEILLTSKIMDEIFNKLKPKG